MRQAESAGRRFTLNTVLVVLAGTVSVSPALSLVALGLVGARVRSELALRGRADGMMMWAEWLSYAVLVSLVLGYSLAIWFVRDVWRERTTKPDHPIAWTFCLLFAPVAALPAYWWRWAKRLG